MKNKVLFSQGSISVEATIIVPIFIAVLVVLVLLMKFFFVNEVIEEILFESTNDIMYSYNLDSNISNSIEKNILFNVYIKKHSKEMNFDAKIMANIEVLKNNSLKTKVMCSYKIPFVKNIIISKSYIVKTYRFNFNTENKIVYITNTGSKYHYKNCIHLRQSSIPININEAIKKGYTPCENCVGGMNYFK
ncbi:hypothetical protein [Helicovermis profundi]|uniref:hypothetical protein n=1 Tax=Helicovermis profundi TaxID=3065157 RepID=UPI0030CDFFC2